MPETFEHFDNDSSGGTFVIGLLAGTVLGAGLGMLFAPKTGAELRAKVAGDAAHVREKMLDVARSAGEAVAETVETGRELANHVRSAVSSTPETPAPPAFTAAGVQPAKAVSEAWWRRA